MSRRHNLAEYLVELDLAIEDVGAWATRPEDVEKLKRFETLRDAVQAALIGNRVRANVWFDDRRTVDALGPTCLDPRD